MPAKCCSCNSSGRCVQCCLRASRRCYNCTPGQHDRCKNSVFIGSQPVTSTRPESLVSACRRNSFPASVPSSFPNSTSSTTKTTRSISPGSSSKTPACPTSCANAVNVNMRRSAHARGIDRPSSSTGDRVAGNRNAKAGARVSAGNDMLGPSCDVQKDNGLSPQATVVSVGCERSACDRVMQVHQLDSCQCAADNSDNTTTGDMVDPTARFADAIGGAYE